MNLRRRKGVDENPTALKETEDPRLREWARDDNSELNNPVPNREERLRIASSVEEREARVLELQLMNARERAIKAPIRTLPPEILSRIFVEADRASNTDVSRISVLLCCRKWLQIGLRTPSLWASVRLFDNRYMNPECPDAAARIQRTLKLAGTSLLDIYSGVVPRHSQSGETEECAVIELLSQQALQIRSIKSTDDIGRRLLLRSFRDHNDLPNMVSFEANGRRYRFNDDVNDTWSFQFSGLQSLTVSSQAMQSVLTISCPLLVRLSLNMDRLGSCIPLYWKFLGSLPNLESLTGTQVEFIRDDMAVPPEGEELLLSNLTSLSMSTNDFHPMWWADFPGNIILVAAPKVSDLEIEMDADVTPNPPSTPVFHVTKLTVKLEGKISRGKNPIAIRKKLIREWLDAFPAIQHLQIDVGYQMFGRSCDFVNTLLDSSAKRGQKPCLTSLADLKLSGARVDVNTLLEFSRKRSLMSEGGVLKSDKPNAVAKCLITISKCEGVEEVTSETANGILAANTAQGTASAEDGGRSVSMGRGTPGAADF